MIGITGPLPTISRLIRFRTIGLTGTHLHARLNAGAVTGFYSHDASARAASKPNLVDPKRTPAAAESGTVDSKPRHQPNRVMHERCG